MSALAIGDGTVVELHPLHIGEEQDGELEVGMPETGVFIALPAEGVALVRWLDEGLPLEDVAARFEAAYGIDTDVADFLRSLCGCGFVRSIDGQVLGAEQPEQTVAVEPRGLRLLAGLPQSRVAWLLSRPALVVYAAIWTALAVLLVSQPQLRPSAGRAFLDIGDLGNLLVLTGIGWTLIFLHEVAHLVAVRARGCTGTLDISHRLHMLVAQTDMTSVRVLPRNQRYAPYLAGMTFDATILLACLVLQAAGVSGLPGVIAYLLAWTLLFQFAIFLRTDVYYVVTNLLRLGNLMHDSRRWLGNVTARMVGAPPRHDLSDVPPRELRFIRWFGILAVGGVALVIGQFVLLGLPLLLSFVHGAVDGLHEGAGSLAFWDSVGVLAVIGAQFAILGVAVLREQRRRRARTARTAAGLALVEEAAL